MEPGKKELDAQEIWKLFAETDRRFKETDRKFQETEEQMRKTDRKVNALTGKWSRFVEGLVVPAAEKLFRERGIQVDNVFQRVRLRKGDEGIEIDVLAVNGEYAVLIEAKSTLGIDDVREHLERMEKFKRFLPEYADRKAVGAVAGIVIDKGVDRFAYKNGLFVIAQSGETVKVLNDEKFTPKVW